jgi:hypothetical protein
MGLGCQSGILDDLAVLVLTGFLRTPPCDSFSLHPRNLRLLPLHDARGVDVFRLEDTYLVTNQSIEPLNALLPDPPAQI